MAHWKSPKPEIWYSIIFDGKRIATCIDSPRFRKEAERYRSLKGISVPYATPQDLIDAKAKTRLPERIMLKMEDAYKEMCRIKSHQSRRNLQRRKLHTILNKQEI